MCNRESFNVAIPTALYHGNIELARRFLGKKTGSKEGFTFEGTDNRFHYEALSNEVEIIVFQKLYNNCTNLNKTFL